MSRDEYAEPAPNRPSGPGLPESPSEDAVKAYRQRVEKLLADNPELGGRNYTEWLITNGLYAAYRAEQPASPASGLSGLSEEEIEALLTRSTDSPWPEHRYNATEKLKAELAQRRRGETV